MTWRPNSTPQIAAARSKMLSAVRDYFRQQDVLEVSTPTLTTCTTLDPNIESVVAHVSGREHFLHTSPEHYMKRLLAAGYPDIYQVCNVYRDGEAGRLHLPEFTMLEWYRRNYNLESIMQETAALVTQVMKQHACKEPPAYRSYCNAFDDALSVDPKTASIDTLASCVDADDRLRQSLGDDRDAWLDLAMATRVADTFPENRLTLVYHYPASQAALARLCPQDETVADRFELYIGSVELANGFVELTDADEQASRFALDQQKRARLGRRPLEQDADLLEALRTGLPESAGVALGIDRLLMIDQAAHDIQSITTFAPGT